MTSPLRDLAVTRLAALCLNRRGRPRGLTFDDHLVRSASILDLAVCGALTHAKRTEADRAAGRAPIRAEGTSRQALAVLAIGSVSGLFGRIAEPAGWILDGLGEARWAGELVVDRLTELRVRMRAIGRAVD